MNKPLAYAAVVVLVAVVLAAGIAISRRDRNTQPGVVSPAVVNSGENPAPGSSVHDLPVEPAAAKARTALAARLGVGEGAIVILSVQPKEWSDACLGLARAGEMCAEVITPGFEVELTANGATYVYRTNQDGSVVRAA